jgi:hypothetical protein
MRKLIIAMAAACLFVACKNEKKTDEKVAGDKTKSNITYPFTPEYSTDFSMGDPNHSKVVLDFIKAWDDNRIKDMRPLLNDTVWANFSDGGKFMGTADSLLQIGANLRNSMSSVESKVDTWVPLHVGDKNEDWVLYWDKEYTTTKEGKTDSTATHSYWQIKNGKIAGWVEFSAKLTPPAPMDQER